MDLSVTVDLRELDALERLTTEQASDACRVVVREAVREGRDEALRTRRWKNRTGETERATQGRVLVEARGGTEGEIVCDVPHARYLSDGTPPHVIEGNPYLHFVWKGVPMTLRRVHHPGTKADPFMGQAYLKAERVLHAAMDREIDRIAELVNRAQAA